MLLLDMRTIIFSYVITNIICLVVIVLLWQQNRKRFAGAGFFVFDFALQTTALFLIVLRGQIPDWISMVLSNTLAMTGALLGYMGLLRFVGKKISQIHNYALLTAFVLIHIYFALVQPHLAARNLNLSVVLLIICFQCAWLMLYRVEPGLRQMTRGVGIVFAAFCVISVIRIVAFFTGAQSNTDYFHSGIFEQFVLIFHQMLFILLTYSLALMFNKRLLLDITTQEEIFSKAFHSSPYAITITRISDGQIIEVNESFFRITGYQSEEIRGKTIPDLHLWDKDDDRALFVKELASKGKVQEREFQFRKKSGEIITGLFSAEIININNEMCVLSSINDITEIKQVNKMLWEQGKDLKASQQIAKVGSWHLDVANNQVVWSEELYKMYGFDPSLPPPPYTEHMKLFTPESWERLSTALANTRETGIAYELELETVRKDGGNGWMWVWGETEVDSEGTTVGLWGATQDITERKRIEEALRESEERFKALHNASFGGIAIHDNGKILDCNQGLSEMMGYSPDELLLMDGFLLIAPDSRELVKHNVAAGFEKSYEAFGMRKNGEIFPIMLEARNVHYKGKKVRTVEFRDITERKLAEAQRQASLAEIIRLNADLENKVAQRTRDLRDSQLALLSIVEDLNASNKTVSATNQSLNAINKELEAFSYSVSHDLRAPLRSIDGFGSALLEDYGDKLNDEGRHYLQRIRKATQHMGELIDDMLSLSRVTRSEFYPQDLNLSDMVRDIAEANQNKTPLSHLRLEIQDGVVVLADKRLMNIALTNLLDNAWKFSSKKEHPHIVFGTRIENGESVFFVRDNGAGFDMAYAGNLFGAFQRLHRTEEFPGTGIGLAIIARIIKRHGGRIWAEGTLGKGAAFYFTLGK